MSQCHKIGLNKVLHKFLAALFAGGLFFSTASAQAETFQEALISAYQSNPRLMAERVRVSEIDENYIQARAAGRLSANITGSAGVSRSISTFNFIGQTKSYDDLEPRAAQLEIIQPLYQGGRVTALKRQAHAGILAAREGLRNAEQTVFLQVANAYIDVLQAEETARIRRNNVRVLTNQEIAAADRFDVGVGTRTDTAQAQSRLAGAEIGLAQADAQLAISRAAYERVVGHSPVDLKDIPGFALPPTLAAAQALGRENNPQLVAAYFNEDAAKHAIAVARAASRPVVSLNGTLQKSAGQSSTLLNNDSQQIAAQIRIPLFSGGANKSKVRAAKHAKVRLGFEARDAERAVDEAIARLWAQLTAARLSRTASVKQVDAAQIAFEGVELEQSVGTRTSLDVLDAEQELLTAKLAVVDAERLVNAASFQLLAALGAFDAVSLQLAVDYYDPTKNLADIKKDTFSDIVDAIIPDKIQDKFGSE